MIDRRDILAIAGNLGLLPSIVEKDYVLSWVLAGIHAHEALADTWLFKGGTCLKKCYFETYRFSEDLDFTLTDEGQLDEDFLLETFRDISAWVYERTGIELPDDKLHFDVYQNRRGRLAAEGRLSYRGPIAPGGDLPRIKLDLTVDELIALSPVERRVAHPYADDPEDGLAVLCYAYEEVFAEKVRALGERASPRDLYDVINLYRHDEMRPEPINVRDALARKCAYKDIPVPTLAALDPARAELEADWESMLSHQLPSLPPVSVFWNELPAVFEWLEGTAQPEAPVAYPMAAGDTVVRAPAGGLFIPGLGSTAHLETIRFAAANRLCVDLDYTDERGRRDVRTIEPYSLRRTAAGDILLHAERVDGRGHRAYRVDRINGAQTTSTSFLPRHTIELTPGGPIVAPQSDSAPRLTTSRRSSSRPRTMTSRSGPTYVYECGFCGKRFQRKTLNSQLRSHKSKDGWSCAGRHGVLIDTRW